MARWSRDKISAPIIPIMDEEESLVELDDYVVNMNEKKKIIRIVHNILSIELSSLNA